MTDQEIRANVELRSIIMRIGSRLDENELDAVEPYIFDLIRVAQKIHYAVPLAEPILPDTSMSTEQAIAFWRTASRQNWNAADTALTRLDEAEVLLQKAHGVLNKAKVYMKYPRSASDTLVKAHDLAVTACDDVAKTIENFL